MMMKINTLLLVIAILNTSLLFAQLPEPSGRRLRIIMEDKYSDNSIIIGATTGTFAIQGENIQSVDITNINGQIIKQLSTIN